MIATSMFEALAAISLEAIVLATLCAQVTTTAITTTEAWRLASELQGMRQVEHVVDRALAGAGAGPARPPAIRIATDRSVEITADLDADGHIDPTTAERTRIEIHDAVATSRLVHRLGRQSMTIDPLLDAGSRFAYGDAAGRPARTAAAATTITVPTALGPLIAVVPARAP